MKSIITNDQWRKIYSLFINLATTDETGYTEVLGINFSFNPVTDYRMSVYASLFNASKAAKMFFWYKKASVLDKSIIDYFPEYKHCIDESHDYFNSNYGVYAYRDGSLKFCIDELKKDHTSRRACFCINNNSVALNDFEIDKLCTNTIHFFIRDAKLEMVVQMRSSNFIKLLPYDAFMFSVFYFEVYKALKKEYKLLKTGDIHMQIASLHYYAIDKLNVEHDSTCPPSDIDELIDFQKDIDFIINQLNKRL